MAFRSVVLPEACEYVNWYGFGRILMSRWRPWQIYGDDPTERKRLGVHLASLNSSSPHI